ncbi:MAG: relaxase domain-containing protein, partial [Chloroflexi bacterium]|nr:relaxase domain-containing protein [Chloroflexota bacterium]
LWAISRADEREAIERAVIDAARRALDDTIFRHCATTRVGAAGPDLRVETGDMLAATFLHRTSRDADPQLHVHSTIFNLVKTHSDGKFRALHGHPLYAWQKAAGAAFRSHLAHLMRTRLDVEMERHGPEGQYTRVAAMDPDLEREWSKRTADIVATVTEHLGEEALSDPAQMAAATLATRRRKAEGVTTEEDIARFREEAAEIVDIEEQRQRIRETPVAEIGQEFIDAAHEEIAAIPAKLARMDAVFRQPDIVEKVENALAGAVSGDAVERWHELSLAGADLVPLEYKEPNADAQAGMAHKRIFTTRDTLLAEHTLTRLSQLSVADRAHAVPEEKIDAKLQALRDKGRQYSDEQVRAIHHAAACPGRLALIEGAAGAGKSHVLHPLADLWRAEGKFVRALAVPWRQAMELATAMTAPPSAIDPFLREVRKGAKTVGADTVLVVDEAGMLSTRQTLQLVQLSETTGCKLVLVGDTQQQQPIEAGPGMRIVRDAVGSVRIDRIRRQKATLEDWLREVDGLSPEEAIETAAAMTREERDAARERFTEMNRQRRKAGKRRISIKRPWQLGLSALLRNGAMHQAFRELHRRGRLGLAEGKEEALHDLVARWTAYTAENPGHSTIVMARTRADVRALSALLRAHHHAALARRAAARGKADEIQSTVIRVHRIDERGKAVEANLEVRLGERLRIGTPVIDLQLYTGDVVTVTGIEQRRGMDGAPQCRLTVRTADKRTISFAPEEIRTYVGEILLDHGYATTATSAQGITVDAAFLLLDQGMARESTYPACTRHTLHLEAVADRQSVAVGIAGATPDGDPGREVSDDEILASLGQLCGRSQPKEAAMDHLLAEKRLEMELEGEIEIGREPVPQARAANDGLGPGTAGTGPQDPAGARGAAARRHADRAASLRIVAAADRRTNRSADRATAVALAADMEEIEREWNAIAAPAEPAADPEAVGEVRRTLDRHRNVLNRVRVFLRSRRRGSEDGRHHPRVSGLGYDAFQGLRRNMQRRWAGALEADDARLAAEAEKRARSRSRSQALEADWTELRARAGQEPLAFLDDPEHAGLLRRTGAFRFDPEIDRDTARSWRSFLDGHYAAIGAELNRAWRKPGPQGSWGPGARVTPARLAEYRRLLRRAEAFWSALDRSAVVPGDHRVE